MARVVERGLRRTVGVPGLFATAYGNVGSSIYYALGLVAAHALGLTPLVFIFAGGLFALTAKTYAEGASMFPEAGGSSSFARHAFNEIASFFAGWALTLDYIITIAISAFFVPHYLGAFFPGLRHNPGDIIGGFVVVAVLAGLNIRGLRESANLNIFLAIADLVTQVLLVLLGAVLIFDPSVLVNQIHLGSVPTYKELIFALSISMVAYTGIETVSNMAEEARDPDDDVPRSVNYVLIAVLGIFSGISIISLVALPVVHHGGHYSTLLGTKYENDPVLGIVSALPLSSGLQTALRYYVGVLAATILVIATNAGLIGISRLSWSLAEHRQLPALFARVHRKYRTPWFTIAFFSVLAMLLLIPGQTDFLGNLYSFGAMLSFTTAHVAVVALRFKDPDRHRPYRAPWNVRVHGRVVPLGPVLGGIGTFAAWISVVVLHAEARTVGIGWMVCGMAGYFLYRRRIGMDPRVECRIERPGAPAGFQELAYRSALVPIFGTDVNGNAMRSASRLAGENATVDALYVIEVPPQLSLEAGMEVEEETARAVLESARIRGRERKLKVRTGVIRTRNAGAALVEEARSRGSEVIYLDTVHAPPSEAVMGPTATYLLRERPCRIVIESDNRLKRGGGGPSADSNGRPAQQQLHAPA
ncbi:MAG: universal stress protein [Actinobacteria bacterium]|nr:MAG: universal stress protein [Actinomycetota bacterium]